MKRTGLTDSPRKKKEVFASPSFSFFRLKPSLMDFISSGSRFFVPNWPKNQNNMKNVEERSLTSLILEFKLPRSRVIQSLKAV
jgi:hypothetical protein